MANRGADAATLAEIAASRNIPFHLLEINTDAGTTYLTDFARDLDYDNGGGINTYLSVGHFLSFSGVTESIGFEINGVSIILSAVDKSFIAEFLTYDYIDQETVIHKGFINASDGSVIGVIRDFFNGRINSVETEEDPESGRHELIAEASSHFVDFERKAGRHTTTAEQELFFSGDKGFDYVGVTGEDIMAKWGKA